MYRNSVLSILILILFSSSDAAIRTWSSSSSNSWKTAANWSGSAVPGSNDTALFDATSIVNCTVDSTININSFIMRAGYTGTYLNKTYACTVAVKCSVGVTTGVYKDSIGWYKSGDGIVSINGANNQVKSSTWDLRGNDSLYGTIGTVHLGYSGKKTCWNGGSSYGKMWVHAGTLYIVNSATHYATSNCKSLIDSGTISCATGKYFQEAPNNFLDTIGKIINITDCDFGISGNTGTINFSDSVKVRKFTYVTYGSTVSLNTNSYPFITAATSNFLTAGGTIHFGGSLVTVYAITNAYMPSSGSCAIYFDSSTCTMSGAANDYSTTGATQTIDLGKATINCYSFTFRSAGLTVVPGTSLVKYNQGGNQTVSFLGKTFYDFEVALASANKYTFSDSLQCHNFTRTTGKLLANNPIRASGSININSTDACTLSTITMTGLNQTFAVNSKNAAIYCNNITLNLNDNTTIVPAAKTYSRFVFTAGKTYTWTAGDTAIITNHTSGNWNGTAGNPVTWLSSSTGSWYYVSAPASVTPTYMAIRDCKNYSANAITVNDGSSQNWGHNIGWTWPAATVTSVTPNHGPIGGGIFATVKGTQFLYNGGATVKFGNNYAAYYDTIRDTLIHCKVPNGAGLVECRVFTTDSLTGFALGSAFSYDSTDSSYRVSAFTIVPDSGQPQGNYPITINTSGSWFINPLSVWIDGRSVTSVSIVNGNQCTGITPVGLPDGTWKSVKIKNGYLDSLTQTSTQGYKYIMPRIYRRPWIFW